MRRFRRRRFRRRNGRLVEWIIRSAYRTVIRIIHWRRHLPAPDWGHWMQDNRIETYQLDQSVGRTSAQFELQQLSALVCDTAESRRVRPVSVAHRARAGHRADRPCRLGLPFRQSVRLRLSLHNDERRVQQSTAEQPESEPADRSECGHGWEGVRRRPDDLVRRDLYSLGRARHGNHGRPLSPCCPTSKRSSRRNNYLPDSFDSLYRRCLHQRRRPDDDETLRPMDGPARPARRRRFCAVELELAPEPPGLRPLGVGCEQRHAVSVRGVLQQQGSDLQQPAGIRRHLGTPLQPERAHADRGLSNLRPQCAWISRRTGCRVRRRQLLQYRAESDQHDLDPQRVGTTTKSVSAPATQPATSATPLASRTGSLRTSRSARNFATSIPWTFPRTTSARRAARRRR